MKFDGSGQMRAMLSVDFSVSWIPYAQLSLDTVSTYPFGLDPSNFGQEGSIWGGAVTDAQASVFGIGGDVANGKTGVGRTLSIKFQGQSSDGFFINSYTMAISTRKN
jgi:hypothetical protein